LKVDTRERRSRSDKKSYFYENLNSCGFSCDHDTLGLGDFLWTVKITDSYGKVHECITEYIIERKIKDDLASSIMDGRYKDQSTRLLQSGIKRPIYIVEGDLSSGFRNL